MPVKIHIHQTQREFADGNAVVEVVGDTVGACLDNLIQRFPDIRRVLFSGDGKLLNNIDIYVNHESTYPEALTTSVKDGDEIHLILVIAGG